MARNSTRPRVLVLTADADPTADAVVDELNKRGVGCRRLDPAGFPLAVGLDAQLGAAGWDIVLDGASLDGVRAVYYRRPGRFAFDPAIPEHYLRWCDGQARYGFWGVLESGARWVNHPQLVGSAEYKPRQLAEAVSVGLDVPPTLITNTPAQVEKFAAEVGGRIVTKTLYARAPRDENGNSIGILYTRTVDPDDYRDASIAATAHLFQQQVASCYDVRVTVVGDALFAARIDRIRPTGSVDWRADHTALAYSATELPAPVTEGVHRLMERLELAFGALDFGVDAAGRHWFYEINPNGQWMWIEQQTGAPIAAAMAELLAAA